MIERALINHAYNFVNMIDDDELYEKIIRTENIGWPLIKAVAKGFVDIEGLTLEGQHYVKCTLDSLVEYGMEA